MPPTWPALPPAVVEKIVAAARLPQEAPLAQQHRFGEDLVVEARSARFSRDEATFEQGVKATYGSDSLTADSLHVNRATKRAQAKGNVVLQAPEGTLSAQDLEFSWDPANRTGSARNVRVELGGVWITAESAETHGGENPRWVLRNLRGTSCRGNPPLYLVESRELVVYPGRRGSLNKPRIHIFGRHIVTLPTRRFSLDRRVKGIGLPSISNRRGKGYGLRWEADVLLDEHTAITADARWFRDKPTVLDLRLTRTYLDPMQADALISPRSDFEERFRDGYFNNIRIEHPAAETKRLRNERRVASIGTSWNFGTSNDRTADRYTSLLEAIYEIGGPMGNLGYQASIRGQRIQRNDGPFHNRVVLRSTLGFPTLDIGAGLYGRLRLDGAAYQGGTSFGWGRAEGGLVWAPTKQIMLGAALAVGSEAGVPLFPSDQLFATRAAHYRLDLDLGPTRLGILAKYDLERRERYDYEYYASQVIGCLEAFLLYRQFPSSYQFGMRLRLDDFFKALRRRRFRDEEQRPSKDERLFLPESKARDGS